MKASTRERREWERWIADAQRIIARAEKRNTYCGARTKNSADHHPCWMHPEPGKKRCKYHGGLSTGPRTPEGRARIAEAQRQRWAARRAERGQ